MAIEYNFKYMPLVGKLSGKSMAEQTETAINEIAKIVNDNTAQAEIINTLAEEANANSVEALEKATEALDTSSRVYIKETGAVDLDSYCESQLIYINNIFSQNLPVESKGFLEVKTNDDKTQATQVFVDDLNKEIYTRSGAITETQVGDITTYTASYGAWNKSASTNYVENMVLIRQNSTAYSVGDIARSTSLASYMLLECTSAGTTGASEPSYEGADVGDVITDGSVSWTIIKYASTEYVREEIRQHANMPIGFEYFTINPNIPQGSLPLFGGEYSRATYSDLWTWVQTQTGYLKTEAQWQALSSANAGNVPYYSDGDGSTTFRVPSLKCWVKGANGTVSEVGSYLAAGLPNITANLPYSILSFANIVPTDDGKTLYASSGSQATKPASGGAGGSYFNLSLNASRSSSIYGNSTTVQPPSIVGMWLVKAYGVIVDTGSIDEQAYIDDRFNASKQYTDDSVIDLKNIYLPANYLPLRGGTMSSAIIFSHEGYYLARNVDGSYISMFGGASATGGASLYLFGKNESRAGQFWVTAWNGTKQGKLVGEANGTLTWNGQPIQTSSDKRLKQDFSNVPADVLEAWGKVEWKQFKYKADVERKGENCRFHTGLVAQDVKEVGEENNVDLLKYGILCHDVREATEDSEAVDLWTVRYEEALAMEVVYLRNEIKKLREEIKALRTE